MLSFRMQGSGMHTFMLLIFIYTQYILFEFRSSLTLQHLFNAYCLPCYFNTVLFNPMILKTET